MGCIRSSLEAFLASLFLNELSKSAALSRLPPVQTLKSSSEPSTTLSQLTSPVILLPVHCIPAELHILDIPSVFPSPPLIPLIFFLELLPRLNPFSLSFNSSLRWHLHEDTSHAFFQRLCFLLPWASLSRWENHFLGPGLRDQFLVLVPGPFISLKLLRALSLQLL